MQIAEHIASLRRDGQRFAEAAEVAGLDAPVPTCPEWRVRDLVGHLGGVHRWAASIITSGALNPPEGTRFDTPGDDELLGWFGSGHLALLQVLLDAEPDVACWTFLPAPSPLAFWARRQAHEAAIHRIDAEAAAGEVTGVAPEFATDGIDELLTGFFARPRGRLVADPPVTLAVHATDTDASWAIRIEPDRRVTTPGARDGDCVLTGTADDLYTLLWNRRGPEGLDLRGDAGVLDLWRAKAHVSWR